MCLLSASTQFSPFSPLGNALSCSFLVLVLVFASTQSSSFSSLNNTLFTLSPMLSLPHFCIHITPVPFFSPQRPFSCSTLFTYPLCKHTFPRSACIAHRVFVWQVSFIYLLFWQLLLLFPVRQWPFLVCVLFHFHFSVMTVYLLILFSNLSLSVCLSVCLSGCLSLSLSFSFSLFFT